MDISAEKLLEIRAKLPNAVEVQVELVSLPIDFMAQAAGPRSKIGIAAVSLRDASEVACEAVYALEQAYSNIVYYREECPGAPKEPEAVFLGKFYADDVALRLYAAGEHVANFIIAFLNIAEADLEPYKAKYTSQQAAVGNYMLKQNPGHGISSALKKLLAEKRWYKTIEYRNIWVHEQPPLIEGQGIVYRRKDAIGSPTRFLGGGDQPEYTIDSLLDMVTAAAHALVDLLRDLSIILFAQLKK
jgi:hypothetical protein